MPRLPNFFLVGAPKAGTTSLYHYLDQHPQIYMSPIKEPHYFADEIRFENFTSDLQRKAGPRLQDLHQYLSSPMSAKFDGGPVSEWPDYLKLFARVHGQRAIGEASVCYLWSKTAPRNIARHCPEARILMVLRNPVERAFSNYLHVLTTANSFISFHDHLDAARGSSSTQIGATYPFLEFGLYSQQVRRYLELFPRNRLSIHFYEDYLRDPGMLLRDVFRFLEVDPDFRPDISTKHTLARVPRSYPAHQVLKRLGVWKLAGAVVPDATRSALRRVAFQPSGALKIAAADRRWLVDFYREDILCLGELLGRDLSTWLETSALPEST